MSHDSLTQSRIHALLHKVINELSSQYFRVPQEQQPYSTEYRLSFALMERFFDEDYNRVCYEFVSIWRQMWYYGFALYDFKLYYQPDGFIYITNLEHCGFRMTEGPNLFAFPMTIESETTLFEHPCFPKNFLPRLLGEYSSLSLLPYYRENSETRNPI